jgi:hypothetical protein
METSCSWYSVSCWMKWLSDELKAIFLWILDSIMSGLARIIELIPVPDFLENMQAQVMTPTVSWFLQPFELQYGLSVIIGAYAARFILRRIPFIG